VPALRRTAKKQQGQEKGKRGYQKALPFLGQAYHVRRKGKLKFLFLFFASFCFIPCF
jgi:hypothetical protein